MSRIAIDIETTGLNPWEDRVVTACIKDVGGSGLSFDEPEDERKLLWSLGESIQSVGYGSLLIGWNHTEFDLPFLAVRYALWGIGYMGPTTKPTGKLGKYGKPTHWGDWFGAMYKDVAPDWEAYAEAQGIRWGLKPVAGHLFKEQPKVVDFSRGVPTGEVGPCKHPRDFGGNEHEYDPVTRPFTILDMDRQERIDYCMSDVDLVLRLYGHWSHPAQVKGQAVLAKPITILRDAAPHPGNG